MMIKLLSGIIVAYIGIVALLYVFQTRMLFPVNLASEASAPLTGPAVSLEVTTPDGIVLKGILLRAESPTGREKPYILGFGGNAWNANTAANYINGLFPDHNVVVFHYRGYPPSAGRPSADHLLSDSILIFDHIRKNLGTECVVATGFSIGSGVAAYLAGKRPLAGLILVSPFDSLQNVANEHYPWLPVRWLLRHEMEPVQTIQSVTSPIAIISAGNDSIIPASRTEAFRQAVRNLVLDQTIQSADHNSLYDRQEFRSAMREALDRIEEEPGN